MSGPSTDTTAAPTALAPERPVDERREIALAPAPRGSLRELWRFRQLIALLVARELKVRYKRSVLGMLWTMLNPLVLMVVYTVVFTTIMPSTQKNFSIFLLSGLLPWLLFSTALTQGMTSVLTNQDLIRKVRVPQAVFPLSVVASNLVNFLLSLVPLFLMMAILRQPFTPALLFLFAGTLLVTMFAAGVTLLLASFTVFFRDVRHLTEVALQVIFFLSPILYVVDQLRSHTEWWYSAFRLSILLNPLAYLVPLVRDPVYYGQVPPLQTVALAAGIAVSTLFAGYRIFVRLEPRHIHHF
jgi:lipopolysaccharide transport system permease protein